MTRLHVLTAAFVCAVLVTVSGCGGSASNQSEGIGETGASLIGSGALAYVAVDSDLDSSQWQKVDDLLHKFPGRDKWLTQLRRELSKEGLDYEDDIAPALGPEVDVAVASGATPEQTSFAVLTKPDSVEKARALMRKVTEDSDEPTATRLVDGWFVASESNEMIDRTLKADSGESLADDKTFKASFADLPTDALAKAYVNGRQLADLVDKYLNSGSDTASAGDSSLFGLDKVDWISAALEAKDDGIRFESRVQGAGGGELTSTAASYTSKLISGVPGDALMFLTFRGGTLAEQIRKLSENAQFAPSFREFEEYSGLKVADILDLFRNEVVFYLRRGAGLPEFSFAFEQPQTEQALATVDRIAARISALTDTPVRTEQRDGLAVKSLSFGDTVKVAWAGFAERVLVTSGASGIEDYRAGGDKLADDEGYKDALAAAGAPDKTGGLVYLDLHASVQLIQSYLGLAGEDVSSELRANLKPLQAFVAYGTRDGELTTIAAFLQIK